MLANIFPHSFSLSLSHTHTHFPSVCPLFLFSLHFPLPFPLTAAQRSGATVVSPREEVQKVAVTSMIMAKWWRGEEGGRGGRKGGGEEREGRGKGGGEERGNLASLSCVCVLSLKVEKEESRQCAQTALTECQGLHEQLSTSQQSLKVLSLSLSLALSLSLSLSLPLPNIPVLHPSFRNCRASALNKICS